MDHARQCLVFVEKALESAQRAQRELMDLCHSDFDRMAILAAIEHLEHALAELRCFGPEESRRPFG
jgi:hypothetical protein